MSNAKPLAHLITDDVVARFNTKWVEDDNGCWVWTAARFPSGYGQIRIAGSTRRAHRVGYVIAYGDPPLDLTLDHLCRVRHCVNPAHLEAVTIKVNTLRGDTVTAERAARTECPRGHSLLDPANLDPSPLRRGVRSCLTCRRDRDRINNRGQQELISRAHKSLGMTQREYARQYGRSREAARRILGESA